MQNLTKLFYSHLVCFTMFIISANYGSTFAQGERKAFEEGDKIISIGINRGGALAGNTNYAPTISFDYGLKGTRGIVSIGGFFSYSNTPYLNNRQGIQGSEQDSTYIFLKGIGNLNTETYTAGLRLGLHYSTRKWDLYGGALIGFQKRRWESGRTQLDYYKGTYPNLKFVKTEYEDSKSYGNSGEVIFSPYLGVRYYFTNKVGIYLEAHPTTLSTGLSFKF
jgi:hypothetical protein